MSKMIKGLKSTKQGIIYLFGILDSRQMAYTIIVFIATLLGSMLEMLGVSAIFPLVSVISTPQRIQKSHIGVFIYGALRAQNTSQFFFRICLCIIILYVLKNSYFIFLTWLRVKYANKIRRETALKVLHACMCQSYDYISTKNAATIIREIDQDTDSLYATLLYLMRLLMEAFSILLIVIYIFIMDWKIAILICGLSLCCSLLIIFYTRVKIVNSGRDMMSSTAEYKRILMEALFGFKEVKVMRKENYFEQCFYNIYLKMQNALVIKTVSEESPAYFIEGICAAGVMGYICIQTVFFNPTENLLPLLSTIAVGAFRILPSLGRISSSLSSILFYTPALATVYRNLRLLKDDSPNENDYITEVNESQIKDFQSKLELSQIFWRYQGVDVDVLQDFNMTIFKGESVGIIGASGVGKSTLLDILLGLHQVKKGSVTMDGIDIRDIPVSWSQIVGYVPQETYLFDASIRENVAFGEDFIDDAQVWNALEKTSLADHIRTMPNGIETMVGERGERLSGGQRQRLAIARALYRNPKILVLDEATSALDYETENSVVDAIESLHGAITIIIVAHRLTTIQKCDRIYEIKDGHAILRDKNEII